MNIIFCDVDGCLNCLSSNGGKINRFIDLDMAKRLAKLVKETDSKIVISSSWRLSPTHTDVLHSMFTKVGIRDRIIGYTPDLMDMPRWREIDAWLQDNHDLIKIDKVVVIDDSTHAWEEGCGKVKIPVFFCQTFISKGLTDEECDSIREFLKCK